MNENENKTIEVEEMEPIEKVSATEQPAQDEQPKGAKERFYDKLPVTKRMMDIICVVLIAAIVVTLVLGVMK